MVSVVAAWACTSTPARAGRLPKAATDTWVEAVTPRFVVYSQRSEHDASRVARHLARLTEVLDVTTRGFKRSDRRLRVIQFRDREAFRSMQLVRDKDESKGRFGVIATAGFRIYGADTELIASFHDDEDVSPLQVATHEYLHVLLGGSFDHLAPWISEGMAEFYSTFRAGPRYADIGRALGGHLDYLRQFGPGLPLRRLIRVEHGSHEYIGGRARADLYAKSWALVHMLATANQGRDFRFSRMLGLLRAGNPSPQALELAYGPHAVDSLEAALEGYVSRLTMGYFRWQFAENAPEVEVRTRELEAPEVTRILGELVMRSRRESAPLARELLLASWSSDSSTGEAAALLAELEWTEKRDGDADRWRQAAEGAPRVATRAFGLMGDALARLPFRRGFRLSWPAAGADSTAITARRLLEAALVTEPERIAWAVPYGLTFLEDSTGLSPGIGALFTAREAEPWGVEVNGALAILYIRAGARSSARELYAGLPTSGEGREWRRVIGPLLALRTIGEAERMAASGRRAEAESLLVLLKKEVPVPGVTADVDEALRRLGVDRRVTAASADTDPSADSNETGTFDDMLAAVHRKEYEKARRILESLLRTAAPHQREALEKVARDLRNTERGDQVEDLFASGRPKEACELLEAILNDEPETRWRDWAEKLKRERCGRSR